HSNNRRIPSRVSVNRLTNFNTLINRNAPVEFHLSGHFVSNRPLFGTKVPSAAEDGRLQSLSHISIGHSLR
ncbi:MAG: hypothetical protein ACTS4T_00850, partial [Candidatus Hodgkinia cicadicola]